VDNELGCHVSEFYGEEDAAAFRRWLEQRYGSIEALNEAWGTAFWSQHYASFEEIIPPRAAPSTLNPTQRLDFQRFSSWVLMDYYRSSLAVIREVTPGVPATTNLMVSSATKSMDYFDWAKDLDVVANDHYLVAADPEREIELAFSADLTRGIAGNRPVDPDGTLDVGRELAATQPAEDARRNAAQLPGARGPRRRCRHVFPVAAKRCRGREVPLGDGAARRPRHPGVARGGGPRDALKRLGPVKGSRVESRVAIMFDYEAWWASELDSQAERSM
jgi:beta-galactosidase